MFRTNWTTQAVDDVLAGTFPASDPPAWAPGMARPAPERARMPPAADAAAGATDDARGTGVIDVSRPAHSKRSFARALASLAGAAGLALLVPFATLAVAAPVGLGVRGLLEAAAWLLRTIG